MIPVEKFDDRNWLWLKLFIGRGGLVQIGGGPQGH